VVVVVIAVLDFCITIDVDFSEVIGRFNDSTIVLDTIEKLVPLTLTLQFPDLSSFP